MVGTEIYELLDSLYEMVEDAWAVPFGNNRCLVDREQVLNILDEIRGNLPGDLQAARTIIETRDEELANAKREAEKLLKDAADQAQLMVSNDAITKEARKRASDIIDATEQRSREIKRLATKFCEDSLTRSESVLDRSLNELKLSHEQFLAAVREQENN